VGLNKTFFSQTKLDDYILRTEKIKKTFGGLTALDGVSISVERQKLTMIIGPNGSGKTTLLNIISGFIRPDSGKVFYKNNDITNLPPHIINKIGIVRTFQIPAPFKNLTVLENLLVASRRNPGESFTRALYKKAWIREEENDVRKATDIMRSLRLDHLWDQKSSELSGGQLKLLEIGRALMNDADTILMDEPAAGVNPRLAHEIFSTIKRLTREKQITFLIIEHRLEIALQYVDRVYAMARGRVIAEGDPLSVVRNPLVVESYLSG
jgi:branched-chain amino acid transport system ATP-binding protein